MQLKSLWLGVLVLGVGSTAIATPLDDATTSMQRYCMAGVCLGMSLEQVVSLPTAELSLTDIRS